MATTPEQRKELLSDRSMVDWDELPGELKESTRSQADDIPRKLRAVRCFMLPENRSDPFIPVSGFTEEELDRGSGAWDRETRSSVPHHSWSHGEIFRKNGEMWTV